MLKIKNLKDIANDRLLAPTDFVDIYYSILHETGLRKFKEALD